jgi:hypothetical protein
MWGEFYGYLTANTHGDDWRTVLDAHKEETLSMVSKAHEGGYKEKSIPITL